MADTGEPFNEPKLVKAMASFLRMPDRRSWVISLRRPFPRRDRVAKVFLVAVLSMTTAYWAGHLVHFNSAGTAHRAMGEFHDDAEHAIILGGIVLERNRHTVVGSIMGCVVGAALGAGTAAIAGAFTAGTSLVLIPIAGVAGCGLVGIGGGALGSPLDDYIAF